MNKEDEDKNKAIFDYYKDWDVISRSIKDFQTYQVGKEYRRSNARFVWKPSSKVRNVE